MSKTIWSMRYDLQRYRCVKMEMKMTEFMKIDWDYGNERVQHPLEAVRHPVADMARLTGRHSAYYLYNLCRVSMVIAGILYVTGCRAIEVSRDRFDMLDRSFHGKVRTEHWFPYSGLVSLHKLGLLTGPPGRDPLRYEVSDDFVALLER